MKKKLISLVLPVIILLSSVGAPLTAHAVTADSTTTTTTSTSTTTDDSAGRAARISAYKAKLGTTLSEAIKTRIAARCVSAQALLKVRSTDNTIATAARTAAYESIISHLKKVSAAAEAKGVSVEAINRDIKIFEAKVAAFTTANSTYQHDLSDLAALDCKADPTAFQAALVAARTDQVAAFQAATAIRSSVADTVKPSLSALKEELKAQSEKTNK